MKFCGSCLLGLGLLAAQPAFSQVSAYVDFSASRFSSDFGSQAPGTNYIYGPTIGLSARVAKFHGLALAGDVHGQFFGGSGERFDGLTVGPRVSVEVKKFTPYAELGAGFARFNDGKGAKASATTDAQLQINGGLDRQISKRFDWRVFEFGYTQYYALGGIYNPKTFNTGLVFHLGER